MVGTGASAIQVIPKLQQAARELVVFQVRHTNLPRGGGEQDMVTVWLAPLTDWLACLLSTRVTGYKPWQCFASDQHDQ